VKRLHSGAAVVGALGAVLALSACSTMSPIQTSESYNPGDGVPASSGPVTARNLLIVASEKGGPGNLSGYLLNTSDGSVKVSFQTREQAEASTAPGTPISLAGREQTQITDVTFPSMAVDPGSWTGIYLVTTAGKTLVNVPVLAPNGFYETLAPEGPAPTSGPARPASTAQPTSTASPAGTGSP